MEFLLYRMSRSLYNLVTFVDCLITSDHLTSDRPIVPFMKRFRKLLTTMFTDVDIAAGGNTIRDVNEGSHQVALGASFRGKRDLEHLSLANTFERAGEVLRTVPTFLRPSDSAFGFIVAVASVSVALPMFLERSQRFSNEYRLYWAVIMAVISMSPRAGESILGFLLKVVEAVIAMLLAWVIYYVAGNGKTPGINVLYWVIAALGNYIPLKMPQFSIVGVIVVITITLIGYELEAKKIGEAAISASGQSYLGIVVFGPAILATAIAGLFVAFVWAIFPYPITEHSILRRDLGGSLYMLGNYYSTVHETMSARIRGDERDMAGKHSPGRRLQKARMKVYNKQMLLLSNMKVYSTFTKWEILMGGRFPKKKYDDIINSTEKYVPPSQSFTPLTPPSA